MRKVFGVRNDDPTYAQGDEWWTDTDSSGGVIIPPDSDAAGVDGEPYDIWYAGGTDGTYNYHLVAADDGQIYVDQFDADLVTLLARWPIPGWSNVSDVDGNSMNVQNTVRHLCANSERIVAICNRYNPSIGFGTYDFIRCAVFDTSGTLLHAWDVPLPNYDFGQPFLPDYDTHNIVSDQLHDSSGSCTDGVKVYFSYVRTVEQNYPTGYSGPDYVASIVLDTGELTLEINIDALDDTIAVTDDYWYGQIGGGSRADPQSYLDLAYDLAVVGGDLVIVGYQGMARATPNGDGTGTPVWWNPENGDTSILPSSTGSYFDESWTGITLSDRGTLWLTRQPYSTFDEFTYNGALVQTLDNLHFYSMEPVRFPWTPALVPPPPPAISAGRNVVRGGCILGAPDTQVFLMDRCGSRTICDITDSVSFNDYGLLLDNDSECEVSLHFKGDASGRACCECLENARTWRNELMVLRGGKVVWGPGPLVTITIQREIGHLVARDITAWLDVRLVHTAYDFVGIDLTTIAKTTIEDALTMGDAAQLPKEWRDMCILDFATFIPSGKKTDMKIIANQKSAGEVLRSLTDKGLNFTVIKRSLIVGADFAWGPIGPLRDADFQGDLEIGEHGLAAATSWRVASTNKTGKAGGIDPYFGLIERAVEGFGEDTQEAVDREAGDRLAGTNPPPVTINIPTDSALSPKAPVCQENLIPGTMVDLAVNTLCRGIQTRQRLTAVDYRNDENGEKVSVTIAPAGNVQLEDTGGGGGGGG